MRRTLIVGFLVLALTGAAEARDRWLHIRVTDEDGRGEHVRLNVPLRFAEGLLADVDTSRWTHGVVIDGCCGGKSRDLRQILEALEGLPDSEFLTVKDRDESVRVAKERDFLVVEAEGDDGERVRARLPLSIVRAGFRGSSDDFDLGAALRALDDYGDIDLVRVDGDSETVHIWVDSSETGD